MNRQRILLHTLAAVVTMSMAVACGPGTVDDAESEPEREPDLPAGEDAGVVGDPWNCGELGLTCVGPLGIGECIDGECQAHVGEQCWSPEFAPTCAAYCAAFDESCAHLGCEGATAYGWQGSQDEADLLCGFGDIDTMEALTISCSEPLEGMVTALRCCCA